VTGLRLRSREDALERERYLFYACVSRASDQVVLSYRSSDEEGNVALPSPFIADVADLFDPEWSSGRRTRLLADVVWPDGEAPTPRERARSEAAASARPLVGGGVADDGEQVRVLGEAAMSHVRHREVLSAGALERFADCPVRWLVESELRPQELTPASDPLTRGSYMHAVLEQLLTRLDGRVGEDSLHEAFRELDEVLAELPSPLAAGRPAVVREGALRAVAADLRRYLAHEARSGVGWPSVGLELRFGFEDEPGSLPALRLSDGTRLRGIVDRVDGDGHGRAIVRDYKTGRVRPEWPGARWSEDRQLQVALYMLVVRELLGLDPVAGVYQPLSGDDLRARGVFRGDAGVAGEFMANDAREREELEAELFDAEQRAVAIAGRMRAGALMPCPETCSRDGCAYPGICRSA
jgi:RecB family exonuclease